MLPIYVHELCDQAHDPGVILGHQTKQLWHRAACLYPTVTTQDDIECEPPEKQGNRDLAVFG